MRTKRLLGAAAAATIAAIAPLSTTIASAAEPTGVGTGTVSSSLLQVDVAGGDLLSVRLLGTDGTSSIDPSKGASSSGTSLTPLTIASKTVPALNVTTPAVSTSSTGAEDKKSVSPTLPNVPAFSGALTADLSSIVDAVGARSGLSSTLSNVGVAGGLLSVPKATVQLGTDAANAAAKGTQQISIPSAEVLNLGAVLDAIGMPLSSLPLDKLQALLGPLGVQLPDLSNPTAVVTSVNQALASLAGQTGALTAQVCSTVDGILGTVGGLAGTGAAADAADTIIGTVGSVVPGGGGLPTLRAAALPSCSSVTGTVQDLVNQLNGVVASVVTSLLDTLASTSLLSVQGVNVGLVADARSTIESSIADVTGTIGSVKVGSLAVPGVSGLDLTAAADVLNAAGDTVSAAVGSVLGVLNAQLADMVKVDVLKITKNVVAANGYNTATAAVTALTATLTPPALLTGALNLGNSAGDLLGQVGATVPALSPLMTQLEAALGGLDLLTAPTSITVGTLSSQGAFKAVAATVGTPTSGELPRTGGSNAAVPAMAAVLVAGIALGIRKFLNTVAA
ncbi:MAG: hypothetical protein QOD30_2415 [Actinomycetota bacterium]|nr:hypothetical protein [Actinomycetota bacterium]